jgi:signal transduction histidine kinase
MVRGGQLFGLLTLTGTEPGQFTDRHIALLETFADQAVIAIENTRLFNELEERLEQQTATSDILRVISKSQTDVQPVFETICANARKLCDASWAVFYTYDGEMLHYAATNDMNLAATEATRQSFPRKPDQGSALGRAILTGSVAYIKDVMKDKDYNLEDLARVARYRSTASVPVLQGDIAIGAISVSSTEPDRFSDRQLGMLQTFADQAVIAIQNTRLFNELQSRTRELAHSVEQLRSLSEVGQAVNSTLDLQEVLSTIVKNAVELSGADSGVVFETDEEMDSFQLRATYRMPQQLVDIIRTRPLQGGEGATGRAAATRQPVQIPELKQAPDYYSGALQRLSEVAGLRSLLAVPLLREGRVLGSLAVARKIPGEFAPEVVSLLQTFAAQSTLAIQNARLFREIAEKSRELEVASQHKSQFLANMSHELRTPLNAILGYTELISDGIYGEMPVKMGEIMERVQSSGRNLLGLINDVLDLSKIEAGQLELAINDYSFHDIVHSVISSVESLAAEKRLKLSTNLPSDLPVGKGDERRIAQVLMNLVGNAIKFTDKGEVAIDVTESDGSFVVSVRDTGPGVPEEQRETIFEEFQQVDSSSTRKKGGTGLGLAISRRIVELHGGEIWLEATSDKGSTFTFSVPVNAMVREVAA